MKRLNYCEGQGHYRVGGSQKNQIRQSHVKVGNTQIGYVLRETAGPKRYIYIISRGSLPICGADDSHVGESITDFFIAMCVSVLHEQPFNLIEKSTLSGSRSAS